MTQFQGKDSGLEILTLILSPISILCLILIVSSQVWLGPKTSQAKATINLCVCLILGNLMILILVDRNYFHLSDVCVTSEMLVLHVRFIQAATAGRYYYA
jgi:hypothetical protein